MKLLIAKLKATRTSLVFNRRLFLLLRFYGVMPLTAARYPHPGGFTAGQRRFFCQPTLCASFRPMIPATINPTETSRIAPAESP